MAIALGLVIGARSTSDDGVEVDTYDTYTGLTTTLNYDDDFRGQESKEWEREKTGTWKQEPRTKLEGKWRKEIEKWRQAKRVS